MEGYGDDPLWQQGGRIDLWKLNLSDYAGENQFFLSLCSTDEKERAAHYAFPELRARFATARGIVRLLLSRYLNQEPRHISLTYGPQGKPAVEKSSLHFNISHSGDYFLFAAACNRMIGVDIETIRGEINFMGIARRFFTPEEFHCLQAMPPDDAKKAFYRLWTFKESVVKALGTAMWQFMEKAAMPVNVEVAREGMECRLDGVEPAEWFFSVPDTWPCCAAAVAVPGRAAEITIREDFCYSLAP